MKPTPGPPASLGFYMPAEWVTHSATWLTWPKDPETWPGRVEQAQQIFIQMLAALTPHEAVNLLVDNDDTQKYVLGLCDFVSTANIKFHQIETVDSWIRDYGPNFLLNGTGEIAFNNCQFNAWGNKYEALKQDDRVPELLAEVLQMQYFEPCIFIYCCSF